MSTRELSGKTALVTGASSGLGVDFARQLAGKGADLVIVARRADALEALKAEIEAAHEVSVRVEAMDLSAPDAGRQLFDRLLADGVQVDLLVNNAGFGMYGNFLDLPLERTEQMIRLNVMTPTQLTWLFGKDMVARGWGRILQIGSTGSYQATPSFAAYSGTKAYDLLFGEGLNLELRGTGVTCAVLCPGFTRTEFMATAGHRPVLLSRLTRMTSDRVARIGIRAMLRGRHSVIAGAQNAAMIFTLRFSPRWMNSWIAGRLVRT